MMEGNPKYIDWLAEYIQDTLEAFSFQAEVTPKRIRDTEAYSFLIVSPHFSNFTFIERQDFLWQIVGGASLEPEEAQQLKVIVTVTPSELVAA